MCCRRCCRCVVHDDVVAGASDLFPKVSRQQPFTPSMYHIHQIMQALMHQVIQELASQ